MRSRSVRSLVDPKRHTSTLVPVSLKTAKFTPTPSYEAPSGNGRPGQTRADIGRSYRLERAMSKLAAANECRHVDCSLDERPSVVAPAQARRSHRAAVLDP